MKTRYDIKMKSIKKSNKASRANFKTFLGNDRKYKKVKAFIFRKNTEIKQNVLNSPA